MKSSRIASAVAWLTGVGIVAIGTRFLLAPEAAAAGYGATPSAHNDAYLAVKGVRDIGAGLMLLTLLSTGQRRTVGWALLAAAIIPAGDAAIVLRHRGSTTIAYGVHGATSAAMIAAAAALLRGSNSARPTAATPISVREDRP